MVLGSLLQQGWVALLQQGLDKMMSKGSLPPKPFCDAVAPWLSLLTAQQAGAVNCTAEPEDSHLQVKQRQWEGAGCPPTPCNSIPPAPGAKAARGCCCFALHWVVGSISCWYSARFAVWTGLTGWFNVSFSFLPYINLSSEYLRWEKSQELFSYKM